MRIVDLNLLLYAVNRDSAKHHRAKAWLEEVLSGDELVALPWVVVLGFLRLTTNSRILPRPMESGDAIRIVDSWLSRPNVEVLNPGPEHWRILRQLLEETGTAANLTTDTHLAALAIEAGAQLCSSDADFARFPHLRWENPLNG